MGKIAIPKILSPKTGKLQKLDTIAIDNTVNQYAIGDFIIAIEKNYGSVCFGEIVKIDNLKDNNAILHIKPSNFTPYGQKVEVGETKYIITIKDYTIMKTSKDSYIDSVKTTLEDNIKKAKEDIRKLHKDILTYQKNLREIKKYK